VHRVTDDAVKYKGLGTLSSRREVVKGEVAQRQMSGERVRGKGRVSRDLETTQGKADKSLISNNTWIKKPSQA